MAIQNFDVEFEDYIIFHRGVQEVSFNQGDNHLHIIYQDGYDQDLGDPLGDRVTMAEQAGTYAAEIETELRALETSLNEKLTNATNLSLDAQIKYEAIVEIGERISAADEYINTRLDNLFENSVTGVDKDEESGKYYVNLTNYSTTANMNTAIKTSIKNIDGIEAYTSGDTEKYYVNPVKIGSRTTEAISNMIDGRLQGVNGINWNPDKQKYEIDISDDAITAEEIHTLFS